jgi:hypothetical protein
VDSFSHPSFDWAFPFGPFTFPLAIASLATVARSISPYNQMVAFVMAFTSNFAIIPSFINFDTRAEITVNPYLMIAFFASLTFTVAF